MSEKTILLIEDDPDDAELTKESLSETLPGYSWINLFDGVEALEYLLSGRNSPPALVILDLKLPRLNGIEVLQRLSREWGPGLRGLKIAVLSASFEPNDRLAARNAGARLYLQKPISVAQTAEMVRQIAALFREP